MRVLVVKPYKLPYEKDLKDDLESLQKEVDGYIEYTYMESSRDVNVVCNEEGIIRGLEPNRLIGKDRGIFGTFLIVGNELSDGKTADLTDDQIKKYKEKFNEKSIEDMDNYIINTMINNISKDDFEIN
ncbi:MAG TPA: DUF3846 domain-containing protein [Bacilli bacterium]|nr:DUF3846 domain-containing protein [Bacilli bacterium]